MPLPRPFTVITEAPAIPPVVIAVLAEVQVAEYPVSGEPPFAGVLKLRVIVPFPAAAEIPVGASGVVAGVEEVVPFSTVEFTCCVVRLLLVECLKVMLAVADTGACPEFLTVYVAVMVHP